MVGQPLKLLPFQKRFIREVYDNPHGTSTAILSIARKNGKTALLAAILLAHVVGPEARQNSQVVSGARSRAQAALVWSLAVKMIDLTPGLADLCHTVPSSKKIIGLPMNVEFQALAADGGKVMGISPVLSILDELGQVQGPNDYFTDAITSAGGAWDDDGLHAEAFRDGDRVLAAGSTERNEGVGGRIQALSNRDGSYRVGHAVIDDIEEAGEHLLPLDLDPCRVLESLDQLAEGRLGVFDPDRDGEGRGIESTEEQVHVGDGERPAGAVAGRPGLGAGALRTDP